MAIRIVGVNIQEHKMAWDGLRTIYGIGKTTAMKICASTDIDPYTKLSDLDEVKIEALRQLISSEAYEVEGDLRRKVASFIKHKLDLGCYEGIRHRKGLPVNGQRTKTNARTRKGKKKLVTGKKK